MVCRKETSDFLLSWTLRKLLSVIVVGPTVFLKNARSELLSVFKEDR